LILAACAALVFASCEDDSVTDPNDLIQGTWNLVGYTDNGVSGVTTGTAVFSGDGTFSMQGTVTYPGEPADTIDVTGTYTAYKLGVTLTTDDGAGNWSTTYSGDELTLRLIGSDPPTAIALKRPG